MKLIIGCDKSTFYCKCGIGNAYHEGHPPMAPEVMPTTLATIPAEALQLSKALSHFGIRPGTIKCIVNDKFTTNVSRRQVVMATQLSKLASTLDGIHLLEKTSKVQAMSTKYFAI